MSNSRLFRVDFLSSINGLRRNIADPLAAKQGLHGIFTQLNCAYQTNREILSLLMSSAFTLGTRGGLATPKEQREILKAIENKLAQSYRQNAALAYNKKATAAPHRVLPRARR